MQAVRPYAVAVTAVPILAFRFTATWRAGGGTDWRNVWPLFCCCCSLFGDFTVTSSPVEVQMIRLFCRCHHPRAAVLHGIPTVRWSCSTTYLHFTLLCGDYWLLFDTLPTSLFVVCSSTLRSGVLPVERWVLHVLTVRCCSAAEHAIRWRWFPFCGDTIVAYYLLSSFVLVVLLLLLITVFGEFILHLTVVTIVVVVGEFIDVNYDSIFAILSCSLRWRARICCCCWCWFDFYCPLLMLLFIDSFIRFDYSILRVVVPLPDYVMEDGWFVVLPDSFWWLVVPTTISADICCSLPAIQYYGAINATLRSSVRCLRSCLCNSYRADTEFFGCSDFLRFIRYSTVTIYRWRYRVVLQDYDFIADLRFRWYGDFVLLEHISRLPHSGTVCRTLYHGTFVDGDGTVTAFVRAIYRHSGTIYRSSLRYRFPVTVPLYCSPYDRYHYVRWLYICCVQASGGGNLRWPRGGIGELLLFWAVFWRCWLCIVAVTGGDCCSVRCWSPSDYATICLVIVLVFDHVDCLLYSMLLFMQFHHLFCSILLFIDCYYLNIFGTFLRSYCGWRWYLIGDFVPWYILLIYYLRYGDYSFGWCRVPSVPAVIRWRCCSFMPRYAGSACDPLYWWCSSVHSHLLLVLFVDSVFYALRYIADYSLWSWCGGLCSTFPLWLLFITVTWPFVLPVHITSNGMIVPRWLRPTSPRCRRYCSMGVIVTWCSCWWKFRCAVPVVVITYDSAEWEGDAGDAIVWVMFIRSVFEWRLIWLWCCSIVVPVFLIFSNSVAHLFYLRSAWAVFDYSSVHLFFYWRPLHSLITCLCLLETGAPRYLFGDINIVVVDVPILTLLLC